MLLKGHLFLLSFYVRDKCLYLLFFILILSAAHFFFCLPPTFFPLYFFCCPPFFCCSFFIRRSFFSVGQFNFFICRSLFLNRRRKWRAAGKRGVLQTKTLKTPKTPRLENDGLNLANPWPN